MTDTAQELQANKGEWSELYVLFKILDERHVASANANLNVLSEKGYTFLKVLREEQAGAQLEYNLEEEGKVSIISDGKLVKSISTEGLGEKTKKIFSAIKDAGTSSFILNDIRDLMEDYLVSKVKASSSQKTDILAVIPDKIGGTNSELGFSIKSHVGGAPTLVNSSSHTNFVYEIDGFTGDLNAVNTIDGKGKVQRRIEAIKNASGSFTLSKVSSSTFNSNLRLADTSFPKLMGLMLLNYYSGLGSKWEVLSSSLAKNDELDINDQEMTNILKTFLRAAALGMVPSKEWTTKLSAYGGYIIVLNTGDLVCYHLLNDDEFREYLFLNTKLDTPSTTKFKFGKIYEDDGKLFMNLNLQIRFLK